MKEGSMNQLGTRSRFLVVTVAVLGLTLAAETVVLGVAVSKSGKAVTAVKTVTETTLATTESSSFVDLPAMSTTVSVPSGQKALLIITFSAEVTCAPEGASEGTCVIQVLVDGTPAAPGHPIFNSSHDQDGAFHDDQFESEANSIQFVAGPVSSGQHVVKVQWLVDSAAGGDVQFRVQERTLTVLRSKV